MATLSRKLKQEKERQDDIGASVEGITMSNLINNRVRRADGGVTSRPAVPPNQDERAVSDRCLGIRDNNHSPTRPHRYRGDRFTRSRARLRSIVDARVEFHR